MRVETDRFSPAATAGRRLTELLSEGEQPILLLLSGGSAFEPLKYTESHSADLLTVTVLDERFSADPEINNFLQLRRSAFTANAHTRGCQFIETVPREGETLPQFASRFEDSLRSWRNKNAGGSIIATVGIGEDGHTAGVLPMQHDAVRFASLFVETQRWIVGYEAISPSVHRLRVTVTLSFMIVHIDHAVVFAVGASKCPIIEKVLKGGAALHECPALVLHSLRDAILITDLKI